MTDIHPAYPQLNLNIFVIIKQVPKQMKQTADGLMDRSGKSMMNPHCTHALEEALTLKDKVGGTISVLTMGPPNAKQSLNEALRKGADRAFLLSDRKLAGSDTWATAEALATTIRHIGKLDNKKLDVLFGGLQTIDGDTAQVPAQVGSRLNLNPVTYVESIDIEEKDTLIVRRIIEGGHQILKVPYPAMFSVTDTANKPRGPSLNASINAVNKKVTTFSINDINLPEEHAGLAGSPTVVSRVRNVKIERGEIQLFQEGASSKRVSDLLMAVNTKQEEEQ